VTHERGNRLVLSGVRYIEGGVRNRARVEEVGDDKTVLDQLARKVALKSVRYSFTQTTRGEVSDELYT
jgi:hypothetical protein